MKQICEILAEKQKNGEVVYHLDFSSARPSTVAHIFYRLEDACETEEFLD